VVSVWLWSGKIVGMIESDSVKLVDLVVRSKVVRVYIVVKTSEPKKKVIYVVETKAIDLMWLTRSIVGRKAG